LVNNWANANQASNFVITRTIQTDFIDWSTNTTTPGLHYILHSIHKERWIWMSREITLFPRSVGQHLHNITTQASSAVVPQFIATAVSVAGSKNLGLYL